MLQSLAQTGLPSLCWFPVIWGQRAGTTAQEPGGLPDTSALYGQEPSAQGCLVTGQSLGVRSWQGGGQRDAERGTKGLLSDILWESPDF